MRQRRRRPPRTPGRRTCATAMTTLIDNWRDPVRDALDRGPRRAAAVAPWSALQRVTPGAARILRLARPRRGCGWCSTSGWGRARTARHRAGNWGSSSAWLADACARPATPMGRPLVARRSGVAAAATAAELVGTGCGSGPVAGYRDGDRRFGARGRALPRALAASRHCAPGWPAPGARQRRFALAKHRPPGDGPTATRCCSTRWLGCCRRAPGRSWCGRTPSARFWPAGGARCARRSGLACRCGCRRCVATQRALDRVARRRSTPELAGPGRDARLGCPVLPRQDAPMTDPRSAPPDCVVNNQRPTTAPGLRRDISLAQIKTCSRSTTAASSGRTVRAA